MNKLNNAVARFLAAGVVVGLGWCMVGCGLEKGHELSEITNATPADSLLYFYGQLKAVDYWHSAALDTTLNDPDSIDAYLLGVEKGLKSFKDDDAAYNKGISDGVRLAAKLLKFERNYGIVANPGMVYNGLALGIKNKNSVNEKDAREAFYKIVRVMGEKRLAQEQEAGEKMLREVAASLKMYCINNTLWCRIMEDGSGEVFKKGDVVKVHLHVSAPDGRDLNIELPPQVEVGSKYGANVFNEAIESMKSGEKSQYATTAYALLGGSCEKFNLMPSDIVLFTISTISVSRS